MYYYSEYNISYFVRELRSIIVYVVVCSLVSVGKISIFNYYISVESALMLISILQLGLAKSLCNTGPHQLQCSEDAGNSSSRTVFDASAFPTH